jgi:hypothetical protein
LLDVPSPGWLAFFPFFFHDEKEAKNLDSIKAIRPHRNALPTMLAHFPVPGASSRRALAR